MTTYLRQARQAIRATVVHWPSGFSWFGRRHPELSLDVRRTLNPTAAESYLRFSLQQRLYESFYCRGSAVPTSADLPRSRLSDVTRFVQELSGANTGKGYHESGWELLELAEEGALVRRGGLAMQVRKAAHPALEEGSAAPGDALRLPFQKEFLSLMPGFYVASGDAEFPNGNSTAVVRLYWDLTPEGALLLVRKVTELLNQQCVPFRLKVLNDPTRYVRCDAAVLYIVRDDYDVITSAISDIYTELATYLKPAIPAFTKQLAPGLGLAEDPGNGQSFGLHRCGLLAGGIIAASRLKETSIGGRLRVVSEHFKEEGISLETPYLNPGSNDIYRLLGDTLPTGPGLSSRENPRPMRTIQVETQTFLDTAMKIGLRLCREAIWHEDRCTWIGPATNKQEHLHGEPIAAHSTLGPDLYAGTSGIALFLAALHSVTGDCELRRTALGAMKQALARADSVLPRYRLGLYTGWPGIALASARVGRLLDEPYLLADARELLARCTREEAAGYEYDLLGGSAGAVAGLVLLHRMTGEVDFLDAAVDLGDELLEKAETGEAGYSWRSRQFPGRNLTGWSHGAAGIAYALLQLFSVTVEARFRDAAEMAFEYERHWFVPEEGNWPDFRHGTNTRRTSKHHLRFATFWCHGAPGIALSRLRAYEILKEETYRAEAIAALRTTCRAVEAQLQSRQGSFTLCHGLSGNAETLLYADMVLGSNVAGLDLRQLALAAARAGSQSFAGQPRPGRADGLDTPGLMTGLAGLGLFFLRIHQPGIPSVILPG